MKLPDFHEETRPVVLVTGAAGGLGLGLVRAFGAAGWRIGAAYHRRPGALGPASENLHPVALDVTDRARVEEVVRELEGKWGAIDVLINNAGRIEDAPVARMGEDSWDRVIEVNLKGAFLCAQAVLRGMMRRRQGHIVNMSSFSGCHGAVGQANYAAAKAGLLGLTKSLAREIGSRNIRVNAVLPGVMATPMTDGLSPEARAQLARANVLGRWNDVEEVAAFMVFLAGMKNVSGQIFQLDSRLGGW